uniref:PX domain-containing protein n=1 Tax=Plectus sambesii TaxID=2011161 RepID=A0A914WLH1_9BILA
MALLELSSISPHEERNRIVRILNYKRNEETNYTLYVIQVHLGDFTWTVERRFRDFAEFDSKRFKDQKRSFLPPKKLVGNSDPNFLTERRSELEKYLRTVVELEMWLQKKREGFAMPRLLARFLDFHQYVSHILKTD